MILWNHRSEDTIDCSINGWHFHYGVLITDNNVEALCFKRITRVSQSPPLKALSVAWKSLLRSRNNSTCPTHVYNGYKGPAFSLWSVEFFNMNKVFPYSCLLSTGVIIYIFQRRRLIFNFPQWWVMVRLRRTSCCDHYFGFGMILPLHISGAESVPNYKF